MARVSSKEHCILMAQTPQNTATKDNPKLALFPVKAALVLPSPSKEYLSIIYYPLVTLHSPTYTDSLHPNFPTWLFILVADACTEAAAYGLPEFTPGEGERITAVFPHRGGLDSQETKDAWQ